MTETDYKATPEQWKLLQRQGQTLGSAESIALLELRSRVETLEATQQPRTFTAQKVAPIVAPTTRLHSYKIGEAEPIEDWGKDHTLVNPEPALSPAVDRMLDLQDRIQMGSLTLAEALDEIAGPKPPSLKEQALEALERYTSGKTVLIETSIDTIRRALEELPD